MQAGGVTITDAYDVSGRVLIDGRDIGADVQSVSLGRDIPSGLPGDSGFTSASGRVTATWGDDTSDRVDHPWSVEAQDPPQVTYAWSGARNASPSEKRIGDRVVARNLMLSPRLVDSTYSQSNVEITHDGQELPNLVITTGGGTSYVGFAGIAVEPGQWFASALSFEWGEGVGRVRHQIQFRGPNNESIETPQIQRDRSNHPTGGRSVFFAQVPAGAVEARWYSWFYLEGSFAQAPDGSSIRVGKYSAAVADTDQGAIAQVAEFFDGDTANTTIARPVWPPRPNARVEVVLSDGTREWTQFKGVITDPKGSTSTRTISFGVRDNYRSLDTLVRIPALSNSMPALVDANTHRYISMHSAFLTDWLLRAGGRYCTPPPQAGWVVSATMMGSTWPERGTITESVKDTPDGGTISFPNWEVNEYGMNVQNVSALYEPNVWSGTPGGGRLTHHPFELTQEIMGVSSGASYLRARFDTNGGRVALVHSNTAVQVRYYRPDGTYETLITVSKSGRRRATARFSLSGSTLTAELRTLSNTGQIDSHGTVNYNVGTGLNGVLRDVWANGDGAQGAFQASFATTPFSVLGYQPNAVMHVARAGRNTLIGVPPQLDANVLDLLNDQADAEFAQWWIDEHDILQWWDRGLLAQQPVVGTLTGADHVKELSWSHDHDSARHQVHVKYQEPEVTQRWRTNLTLWEGRGESLEEGDTSEIFVNVPNDEIWLGVDTENPTRYQRTTQNWWVINRGIRTVMGGIAVDDDGNERLTNSIVPSVRRVTDETYVFNVDITALNTGEQAVFEFPSDSATDPNLWARWRGKGLPILRGKKRILFQDATETSSITGDPSAPDYTHDHGWWIQEAGYAGQTADYAAASLTQPRPRIDGLNIMPVLALQAGDHIRVTMPDVMELELTGVVTSNNLDADLAAGTIQQSISIMPTNIASTARQWRDFGHTFGGTQWQTWAQTTTNETWSDFGNNPLK